MQQSFIKKFFCAALFSLSCAGAFAQPSGKPNILWIVSEDNSARYMPMYADKSCKTPNLTKLAESGLVFKNAHANAPVCAVARSTILTGANPATLGTHNMRSRYPIPAKFKPYPLYFKEAGYYCQTPQRQTTI